MKIGSEKLLNRSQTGKEIFKMAEYWHDLDKFGMLDLTLIDYFNFVASIPYIEDPNGSEIVARPKYLLNQKYFKKLDCKKKAVLIAAYLNAHGYKPGGKTGKAWRIVAVSEKPNKEIHHVFIQALINEKWRTIDPTYAEYRLFDGKPSVTYAEELLI